MVNLLSKEFAWSNKLQEITPLTSRMNESLSSTATTQTDSTAPGEKDDPYRIVLFGSDDDGNDVMMIKEILYRTVPERSI